MTFTFIIELEGTAEKVRPFKRAHIESAERYVEEKIAQMEEPEEIDGTLTVHSDAWATPLTYPIHSGTVIGSPLPRLNGAQT